MSSPQPMDPTAAHPARPGWGQEINIGMPASLPPGTSPWQPRPGLVLLPSPALADQSGPPSPRRWSLSRSWRWLATRLERRRRFR
jgi:hypothetical protein